MKNRKKYFYLIVIIAVAIPIIFAVSLSYYNSVNISQGEITLGELDFTITADFEDDILVLPNQKLMSNINLSNTKNGENFLNLIDFYFRVKFIGLSNNAEVLIEPLFENKTEWVNIGEYYYYKNRVKAGENISVCKNLLINKDTPNEFQGKVLDINIIFEAIQFNGVEDVWGEDVAKNLII